jgi:Holliday junction resolvasome RuvABC endonuclease subunit
MENVILALDVASRKTGYAIYRSGQPIKSGTWVFSFDKRFWELYSRLKRAIEKYHVTQIVAEDIFKSKDPKKASAFQVLAGCRGVMECAAQLYDLPVRFINPLIVKSVMGIRREIKGKEIKKRMIIEVEALGYQLEKPDADDEADAIGVLLTYLKEKGLQITHPKSQ